MQPVGDTVPDSAGTVRGGRPSLARWPGTSVALGLATSSGPRPDTPGCSTPGARSRVESDARSASTAATEADTGDLAIPVEMEHDEGGPREVLLPTVKPRFGADYFEPRRLLFQRGDTFLPTLIPSAPDATHPMPPATRPRCPTGPPI